MEVHLFQNQAPLQRSPGSIMQCLTSFPWQQYGMLVQASSCQYCTRCRSLLT